VKVKEGVRLPPSKLTFHRIRSSKDGSGRLPDLSTSTVCTCGVVSTTAFLKMWRVICCGSLLKTGSSVYLAGS